MIFFLQNNNLNLSLFLTQSYQIASKDLEYSIQVICITYMMLYGFCPFWSLYERNRLDILQMQILFIYLIFNYNDQIT